MLPEPGADDGQCRRARVSASLLDRERALPVPERLDPEPHAVGQEARHGLDARGRFHERLLHGVVRVRRPQPQRVWRRRGRQRESPAEHPRDPRSVGLRAPVRELPLHRHGRSGRGTGVGTRQHRELRRRSRQRDDLRAVRRRRQSRPHAAHAGREGPLPQGGCPERRQQHLPHDGCGREHQGTADDRGPHAQEPEPHGRPDRQAEDGALFAP